MAEQAHTAGPWGVYGEHGYFTVLGPDAKPVAHLDARDRDESIANADLVAAAPDLLEAAKHAVMEWRLHGQLTDSCRVLERAIAKAVKRG